jgi:hypothetical protein
MLLETAKIVSPVSDENPYGFIVINKSDLTDEHELFVEEADEDDQASGLHIGKGPRGKLYVKRDKERVAGPFETQEEAEAALEAEEAK